jgi:hypothetical protein
MSGTVIDDFLPFLSRYYLLTLGLLVVSRGMDMLSTWVATPNLVLEGNPIAKKLGWRWGLPINLAVCLALAFWPLPAIVISTTSVLVAARNFQSAWLMRSLGEQAYRDWHVERIQETRITLFLFCLAGNTVLTAGVGAAVIYFSNMLLVPFAIGVGIMAYSGAVAFYTVLAIFRMRRAALREQRRNERAPAADLPCEMPPRNSDFAGAGERVLSQLQRK